jgi:Domain of unknown function (DUF4863)
MTALQSLTEITASEAARRLHAFRTALAPIVAEATGHALDHELAMRLNAKFPADSPVFRAIADVCHAGIREGWVCNREAGGIRFGRVVRPADGEGGFSVDVVDMHDVAGPHHVHPNGEIDMIMPIDSAATFDGHGAGWCVYGAGSAHRPTVSGGRALVLYLLPDGAIQFTGD